LALDSGNPCGRSRDKHLLRWNIPSQEFCTRVIANIPTHPLWDAQEGPLHAMGSQQLLLQDHGLRTGIIIIIIININNIIIIKKMGPILSIRIVI
jgi:hypothetical protein